MFINIWIHIYSALSCVWIGGGGIFVSDSTIRDVRVCTCVRVCVCVCVRVRT